MLVLTFWVKLSYKCIEGLDVMVKFTYFLLNKFSETQNILANSNMLKPNYSRTMSSDYSNIHT